MKTIVCYGDSNTWGFMPKQAIVVDASTNRYPWGVRWPSRLQMALGEAYRVVEAGLNGRTTIFDCPFSDRRNGLYEIDVCMLQQMPVDLVTIMLGTNDVKECFHQDAYIIARGARRIIEAIRAGGYGINGKSPEILLISPIRLHKDIAQRWLGEEFGPSALEKDAQLGMQMERVAKLCNVHFLNAGDYITADPSDGVHMNDQGHAKMAELLTEKVREILG